MLAFYGKAIIEIWESFFPKPDKITWLEKQALASHKSCGAHIAKLPEDEALIQHVGDIYARDGKKTPKIIIYESSKPNAMHLGNGTLCISTAKLERGDPIALDATIAHEEGHLRQRPLTIAFTALRGAFTLGVATFATQRLMPQLQKAKAFTSLAVTATFSAVATASHYITAIPWSAFRRWKEFDADTNTVRLTGSAEGMIRNFEYHDKAREAHQKTYPAEESTGFAKTWKDLTATHPSHEKRVEHLRAEEAKRGMNKGG